MFAAVWYQEIALAAFPMRRYASPRRSLCEVSLGSCLASCSRTSTAFSSFPFLRSSAAESLSFRVSTKSLAMRAQGYRARRALGRMSPAFWSGRAVAVAPRRQRRRPRGAGLRLLARLVAERFDLGASERTHVPRTHTDDVDAAVIGPVQLQDRRADRV